MWDFTITPVDIAKKKLDALDILWAKYAKKQVYISKVADVIGSLETAGENDFNGRG